MKKFVNDPNHFVREMMEGLVLANPDTLRWLPEHNIIYRAGLPSDDKVSIIQGSGSGHEPAHIMLVGRGMLDADDVAVQDSLYTVGRRGVAGNFFVIKACGAAAEQGAALEEVVEVGQKVNAAVRTMGVALTSCTPPAKGKAIFEIGDDEMEVGVGIHGEPGRRRARLQAADPIVDEVFEAVASDFPLRRGDRVGLMINGLGGTPVSELYLLYRRAALNCGQRGLDIARSYVGNYCTSLEMAGFSLTLIRFDAEIERLVMAPADIPIRVF